MTTEEKARAYNEALEHARAEILANPGLRKTWEEIFPELAESEDERIRRTLVEYFGPKVQLDFVRGVPIQKIRDWLEKQKEQKPQDTVGRVSVEIRSNLQTDEVVRKTLIMLVNDGRISVTGVITSSDILNWLEGQKEPEVDLEEE